MRNLFILPLLVAVFIFFSSGNGFLLSQSDASFTVHNFTKQNYQAENQNWSITEDNLGYIYSANNIGLLEFDGIDWSFFPSPNGTMIRTVAVDSQNHIFTGGYRELGFWERDSLGDLHYNTLTDKAKSFFITNEEFWTALVIEKKVYFHSFSSLFIYDYSGFKVIRPGDVINSIGKFGSTLLVHITGRGIFSLNDTLLIPFITDEAVLKGTVKFMVETNQGKLLIGTADKGIFLFDKGKLTPFAEELNDYFFKNEINRAAITKEGLILLGTILDGISVFKEDGKLLYRINNKNGLQNNTILGIYNDNNNNIWLSLDRGIDFVSLKSDPSYSFEKINEVGAVYSAALLNGNIFLATNQGVFTRKWDNPGEKYKFIAGTQGQTWNCNVFEGQLLISHNNGSFLLKNDKAEKISNVGGGFSVISDPKHSETLIQSTYSNIVFYKKESGYWQYSYFLPGFNNLIRYIELDHLNNLWASHMHTGVYRLKLNDAMDSVVMQDYYGAGTFNKENNIQVFQVENRVVFTTGTTIFTYDDINDTIIPYVQLNKEMGDYATSHRIVAGPDHHYWFISRKGIALFRILGNSVQKIRDYPIELFKDHLVIGFENLIPIDTSTGLLCLDNGYAILRTGEKDFSHLVKNKTLRIESIEFSNSKGLVEKQDISKQLIKVPYNKNSLSIRCSFPKYSTGQVKFQSYLSGMDTGWSEPIAKPEFSYKRIPSGEYTLRIKALNNWMESGIPVELRIIVSPPWYLKKISIVLYLLIVLITAFIIRRMVISRMHVRVNKVRDAKERELIRVRNEKLNSELAFKSQELANSTMSIIKKNEFLLEIKEIVKSQKEELGLRYPDKYYQKIMRKIDANISSMDDWNIFETHFERAHEKFLQKLMGNFPDLSPSDLRLCAYLRMNLSSKEIAPLLRISVRGVENHRYKLRKKLNLKKDENLIDFILGL